MDLHQILLFRHQPSSGAGAAGKNLLPRETRMAARSTAADFSASRIYGCSVSALTTAFHCRRELVTVGGSVARPAAASEPYMRLVASYGSSLSTSDCHSTW